MAAWKKHRNPTRAQNFTTCRGAEVLLPLRQQGWVCQVRSDLGEKLVACLFVGARAGEKCRHDNGPAVGRRYHAYIVEGRRLAFQCVRSPALVSEAGTLWQPGPQAKG